MYIGFMSTIIDIKDQRSSGSVPTLEVDQDSVEAYCALAGIDLPAVKSLRIRFRSEGGPYGYTKNLGGGHFRVVINIRYKKVALSEAAQYVVNNTLLHELRHVAQMQGPKALSPAYEGWSETEAREFGRKVKGSDLVAVR